MDQTCENIMKPKGTIIGAEQTVLDAAKAMRQDDVGFLPVCDSSGKVIGAVTDRDIVTRVVAQEGNLHGKVGEVASSGLLMCDVGEPASKALELMERHQVQRVICTDQEGKFAGIIGLATVSGALGAHQLGETTAAIKESRA
ncbi:MAG: CBS domain-containing protein [Deltaproteobacteria bacterium]|nr:MAG: CBS domain-containing protein [Deltaproteobacteria bacterium]